jgi:PAS domain S-box-containing protein
MMDKSRTIILDVDDNDISRHALSRILRQAGFAVKEAATDEEALRLAAESSALVILDANPPLLRVGQAEAALRESEEHYRILFEGVPVGLYRTTPAGQILDANPAMVQMLGYPDRKSLLAVNAADIYANSQDRLRQAALLERERMVRGCEIQLRRYDGTIIWVRDTVRAVRDAQGQVLYYDGSLEDVTERKRAEEALRESEKRFRVLIENSQDVITLVGADGTLLYDSPAITRVMGYAPDERVGRKVFEFIHSDERQTFTERFEAFVQQPGAVVTTQGRFLHKDGSWLWIEGIRNNLLAEPSVQAIVVNYRDITERKRAEEALQENEQRIRSIVQTASDAIITADSRGGIVSWNRAAETMFGYTVAEAVGQPLSFIMPERFREAHRAAAEWASSRGESRPIGKMIEVAGLRKDGTEFPIELSLATWKAVGENVFYAAIIRDITERKLAEEALAKEHALFCMLMDNVPDAIYFKDAESRFTLINQAQACRFGLSDPAQAVGKTDFHFFTEEHARPAYEDEQTIIRSGQPLVGKEEKETWPDGRVGWVSTTKMPLRDQEGRIVGTFGISRDITERKLAEEQIKAALAEKEVLLREVHHRVKNNLQAIIALISMQAEQIRDARTTQSLKELQERTYTMALVYEHLYQAENLAQIPMKPYLQDLSAHVFKTFGGSRAIKLSMEAAPVSLDVETALPCGLIVDELVTNALKYAFPADVKETDEVRVEFQAKDVTYTLVVSDNGVGLPSGLDWRRPMTMGLRLVSFWATHQLGGKLEVDNRQGTAFKITFVGQRVRRASDG